MKLLGHCFQFCLFVLQWESEMQKCPEWRKHQFRTYLNMCSFPLALQVIHSCPGCSLFPSNTSVDFWSIFYSCSQKKGLSDTDHFFAAGRLCEPRRPHQYSAVCSRPPSSACHLAFLQGSAATFLLLFFHQALLFCCPNFYLSAQPIVHFLHSIQSHL